MKPKIIATVLLAGVLLNGCFDGGKKDMAGPPAPPPAPPAPLTTDFNTYFRSIITSTSTQDTATPAGLENLMFTFTDNDDTAFNSLIP